MKQPEPELMPLAVASRCLSQRMAWLGDRSGIRVLLIKGSSAAVQGLRPERQSTDVDVLVHPRDHGRFLALCETHGWHRRPESLSWSAFITHSVTLIRDSWPCDIDLHRSFPGLIGEPGEIFDRLWSRSVELDDFGHAVRCPGRADHVVVLVAHALRSPHDGRSKSDLAELRSRVLNGTSVTVEEYMGAARGLGAERSTADFLRSVGHDVVLDDLVAEEVLWDVHRRAVSHTLDWFALVSEASWTERTRLLWRGLWPNRTDLQASYPGSATTRRQRARLRGLRLGRAARQGPHVLASWARSRGARRQLRTRASDGYGLAQVPTADEVEREADRVRTAAGTRVEISSSTGSRNARQPVKVVNTLQVFTVGAHGVWAYDPASDNPPMTLNDTSVVLLDALGEPKLPTSLAHEVAADYGVDVGEIESDVHTFVDELLELGVVRPADGSRAE